MNRWGYSRPVSINSRWPDGRANQNTEEIEGARAAYELSAREGVRTYKIRSEGHSLAKEHSGRDKSRD